MSEIQRYSPDQTTAADGSHMMHPNDCGLWVLESFHVADKAEAVKELDAENKRLRDEVVQLRLQLNLPTQKTGTEIYSYG